MFSVSILVRIKEALAKQDYFLLFFLLMLSIDMVILKPIVILFGLVYLNKKLVIKNSIGFPLFYIIIVVIEVARFILLNSDYSKAHWVSFAIGISYWVMAGLAFLIVRSRIFETDRKKIDQTLVSYFYINVAISIFNLIAVMIKSHSWNPFLSEDLDYGNSTGDYIKGLFMAPCFINMFVNTFFAFYFMQQRKYKKMLVACTVACFTSCNFANIIFIPFLLFAFIKNKERELRKYIIYALLVFVGFYAFFSNGNLGYIYQSVFSSNQSIDWQNINSKSKVDSALMHVNLGFKYGKLQSFQETFDYVTSSPKHFFIGAGIGNFSSQLALRTSDVSGLQKSRLFKYLPTYIAQDFRANHYKIFKLLYSLPGGFHSVKHQPNSTANQLAGEYGLIGVILFFCFYLLYFLKHYKQMHASMYMLIMLCAYMLFDYLFEYLSVVVIFELFYILDCKTYGIIQNDMK